MKSLRTVLAQFAVSLLCLLTTHAQQTAPSPPAASQANAEVELLWGARIPVRDGIKLNATVYKPANMSAPLPVVFTLTPYIADTYHDRALYFARNGYVFALVDTRGRGSSEGKFEPFANGARDGHDVVDGNGLVYHSEPFAEDTEITGNLRFTAWIKMDVRDTDFIVQVYEIKLDGASVLLTDDMMRARYRESLRQERLVVPGEINRYVFDSFQFFSRRIAKGSRLRLLVSSPNSIHLQKNYNSGGVVAAETRRDARTARITLYHDRERPSSLEIPVVNSLK